jgi:hypothetical protein
MSTDRDDCYPYQEANRHLGLILNAAAHITDDPNAWDQVESAIGALLEDLVRMISEQAQFPWSLPTLPEGPLNLQAFSLVNKFVDNRAAFPQGRALKAIENGLKHLKKRNREAETRKGRFSAGVDFFVETEKGSSRQEAMRKSNANKQYLAWVRRPLIAAKLWPPPQHQRPKPKKPIPYAGKERRRRRKPRPASHL